MSPRKLPPSPRPLVPELTKKLMQESHRDPSISFIAGKAGSENAASAEVPVRLPTSPHPFQTTGFLEAEGQPVLSDSPQEERACLACRPTGLPERKPSRALSHTQSVPFPGFSNQRSLPLLQEGVERKAESPSQYLQKDRCFYFMGLQRDAWKRKEIILFALYWCTPSRFYILIFMGKILISQ